MSEVVPPSPGRDDPGTSRVVLLPRPRHGPVRSVGVRLLIALAALAAVVVIVYVGRDGYNDTSDGTVDLLDATYYATVSLSTTGYGDVVPVSDRARLINVLVVTPLRVLFLIVLVGTTLEALTESSRAQLRLDRWRKRLREHTVVVGFGTKGRSAAATLVSQGVEAERIVVVDPDPAAVAEAGRHGFAGVVGDATRTEVLRSAEVSRAKRVIVAAQRDDTAVLVTLTARQLAPRASIVVAVREAENASLLRQSGADSVVTSSDAAGRLLGLSTLSPSVGAVMEDLLDASSGLEVAERPLATREVGASAADLPELVVAVVRHGKVHAPTAPACGTLQQDDRVVFVRVADRRDDGLLPDRPERVERPDRHDPRGRA